MIRNGTLASNACMCCCLYRYQVLRQRLLASFCKSDTSLCTVQCPAGTLITPVGTLTPSASELLLCSIDLLRGLLMLPHNPRNDSLCRAKARASPPPLRWFRTWRGKFTVTKSKGWEWKLQRMPRHRTCPSLVATVSLSTCQSW